MWVCLGTCLAYLLITHITHTHIRTHYDTHIAQNHNIRALHIIYTDIHLNIISSLSLSRFSHNFRQAQTPREREREREKKRGGGIFLWFFPIGPHTTAGKDFVRLSQGFVSLIRRPTCMLRSQCVYVCVCVHWCERVGACVCVCVVYKVANKDRSPSPAADH